MSSPDVIPVPVYQSSFFLSMNQLKVELGPDNRSIKILGTYSLWNYHLSIMIKIFEKM